MKLLERFRLSIYLKLVLSFLIVVIPLYALSMLMNDSGSATVKEEISRSMLSRVNFYLNLVETDFERTIHLLQEYVNDEELGKLSVTAEIMSDFDRTEAILRLQRRLVLMKESSNYIRNASIHIPLLNRTISTNDFIGEIPADRFQGLSVVTNRFESPFIVWKDRIFISIPYPDGPRTPKEKVAFLIEVEVDKEQIRQALTRFTDSEHGGAVLIDNDFRWMIDSDETAGADAKLFQVIRNQLHSGANRGMKSVEMDDKKYIFTFEKSTTIGTTLLMYMPEDVVLGPIEKYKRWFWALSFVSFLVIVFFSSFIYQLIHQPLKTLVSAFKRVKLGDMEQVVKYRFKDEFAYLYLQFNHMVEQLKVLIHEVYEQKYRVQLAELRQLQAQINPHFLYNSFFNLYRLAKAEEYESVMRFTTLLGEYFQFITRDGSQEVTLEAEIKFVKTYVDIQSVRFSRRIQAEFEELPEAVGRLAVPRLIVQPIVENAYNHGLENKTSDGRIRVSLMKKENFVILSVEDNGEELSGSKLEEMQRLLNSREPGESTGLVNVHRRIQIKYGETCGIELSRGEWGGLKVDIAIPYEGG